MFAVRRLSRRFQERTPIADCQNENECARNNIKGSLHMQTRACRFSPFQEVKIQEMVFVFNPFHASRLLIVSPRQIRSWSYPPIHDHPYEWQSHPHDESWVHLGGIFLPIPYTGFQAIRAGLLTDTYLVHHIHQFKRKYSDMEVTAEMRTAIERLYDDPTVYQHLAFSIAPEIYGHIDVKRPYYSFWWAVSHEDLTGPLDVPNTLCASTTYCLRCTHMS